MNRMTGTFVAIVACGFLAVVVFFFVDVGGERTFATPQDAFDAARAALQKNDMRGFCGCVTTESRDLMAASIVGDEYLKKQDPGKDGGEEKKDHLRAVEAVFTKYGLTDEFLSKLQRELLAMTDDRAPMEAKLQAAKKILEPVTDRSGLIADTFTAVLMGKAENPFTTLKDTKLSNVKITGKTAIGAITKLGTDRPAPMHFRKQGEGWRIDLFPDEPNPMRGMPGLPPGHP
jgi:hypothetical protein